MYNTVEIAQKIKETAKRKNIILKKMLEDCGMNKNAISTMISRGSFPQVDNLAKIADYLDCSVDYLLGRTNEPQINKTVISNNHIIGTGNSLGGSITINNNTLNEPLTDELTLEMNRLFLKLTTQEKISFIQSLYEKENR